MSWKATAQRRAVACIVQTRQKRDKRERVSIMGDTGTGYAQINGMSTFQGFRWQTGLDSTRGMKLLIASVAASVCLCGCEPSTKNLVGGYKLERFAENGMYYVIDLKDTPGGGTFDGTVDQIGWNENWILARVTRLYHGDTNGWYAMDVKAKRVIGPIQESELSANMEWSHIKCSAPELIKR